MQTPLKPTHALTLLTYCNTLTCNQKSERTRRKYSRWEALFFFEGDISAVLRELPVPGVGLLVLPESLYRVLWFRRAGWEARVLSNIAANRFGRVAPHAHPEAQAGGAGWPSLAARLEKLTWRRRFCSGTAQRCPRTSLWARPTALQALCWGNVPWAFGRAVTPPRSRQREDNRVWPSSREKHQWSWDVGQIFISSWCPGCGVWLSCPVKGRRSLGSELPDPRSREPNEPGTAVTPEIKVPHIAAYNTHPCFCTLYMWPLYPLSYPWSVIIITMYDAHPYFLPQNSGQSVCIIRGQTWELWNTTRVREQGCADWTQPPGRVCLLWIEAHQVPFSR